MGDAKNVIQRGEEARQAAERGLTAQREQEPEYRDVDGNVVTLDKLCRLEPEWAANNHRVLLARVAVLEREKAEAWGIRYCCDGSDCACAGRPIDPPKWWVDNQDLMKFVRAMVRQATSESGKTITGEQMSDDMIMAMVRASLKASE